MTNGKKYSVNLWDQRHGKDTKLSVLKNTKVIID